MILGGEGCVCELCWIRSIREGEVAEDPNEQEMDGLIKNTLYQKVSDKEGEAGHSGRLKINNEKWVH